MFSDVMIDARIKGWEYADQARIYFEVLEPGCVRFKGGTHEQVLTYSFETRTGGAIA